MCIYLSCGKKTVWWKPSSYSGKSLLPFVSSCLSKLCWTNQSDMKQKVGMLMRKESFSWPFQTKWPFLWKLVNLLFVAAKLVAKVKDVPVKRWTFLDRMHACVMLVKIALLKMRTLHSKTTKMRNEMLNYVRHSICCHF